MKSWTIWTIWTCTLLAAAPVLAQPGQTPTTPPPQPAPAPQPAPPAGDQGQPSESPESPSWLPGVQDVTAAEIATPGKLTITMARAVELALRQQPTVRTARAQADAAAGHVEQARVTEHPTLSLAGTLGASSQQKFSTMTGTSSGGFWSSQESAGLSATASWRIYDFGQTRANVHAAEASEAAAVASIDTTGLDVQQSVEIAYLESVARHRLVIVAQATVASEGAHLDQAKRFVAAQAHDPIEVAQAQARLANAQSTLAQAQANEAAALASLRAAIGWIDPTRTIAVDPNWPVPSDQEPPDLASLVAAARQHRPEIVALDRDIDAANEGLVAARAERRPVLSATASTSWNPNSNIGWSPEPAWQAGLTLSWLAWDGGKSAADQHIAHANLEAAVAQRDELLVTLTSALESTRAQIVTNRAAVQAATEGVTAAQAELKLADARYTQGLGSQIELADAQTAVTTAQGNLVSAQWQLADAWASLRRALGER